jgi:hypothetical protein
MSRPTSGLMKRCLIFLLLNLGFFALNCSGFKFKPIVPWGTSPLHRYGHTMVETGAGVFLFGGASQGVILNDLWKFNGMSSTWLQYYLNSTCISPRYYHAAAKLSLHSLIISGGLSNFTTSTSALTLSDAVLIRIDSNQEIYCSQLAALPVPLFGHSMSSTARGAIILFGGFSKPDTGSSHVWLLQNASFDKNAKWLLLSASGSPPSPRAFFVSGLLLSGDSKNEILVIWGGLSTFGEIQTPLFTFHHENTEIVESGWKWSSPVLKGYPPVPRAYAASAYTSRTLHIHGGQSLDGTALQDLWFLDRDIAGFYTWKPQSLPASPPSVWGHTLTVFGTGNQILFYGGQKADGTIEHQMMAFLIGSGETSFVNFAGDVPAARHSAALSCLGNRLILHGGGIASIDGFSNPSSMNPMNDVWQFHLSNAQWSPLRPFQPAAIGSLGNQSLSFSNSSNYTHALNSSFQILPQEQAPRLLGHSMLSLGPIFIIFGGFSQSVSSGASCKPDNRFYSLDHRLGRWTQLQPPTSLLPPARGYHAHAVTPSSPFAASLIVFGGIGNNNQVLGDTWVIALNLFKQHISASANATDRMLVFDFNCRHVSFDALVMKPLASFSVSFWIFANVIPDEAQFLIGSASQTVKSSIDFAIYALPDSCTLQVSMNVGGQTFVVIGSGKVSICDIGWHHIAFTFNGAMMQGTLYIDGVPDALLAVPTAATLFFRNPFFIGYLPMKSHSARLQSCWSGFIDRFSFWNVSLTPSEVDAFQFNSSNAYIQFGFDSLEITSALSKGSGMIQASASFGSGNIAQAPALLPSSCPILRSDLKFNFSLLNSWTSLPSGPSNRSHAMMTSVTNSDVILFGGRDASGSDLFDLWILRSFDVPALAKWERIVPVQNMGSPMSHSIVSTLGQFQVVIVGYNSSSGTQVSLIADVGGHEKHVTRQYFDVRLPPAIGIAHCKCIDNTLWAFGGQDAELDVPFDGFFRSDLSSPFVPVRGSGFTPPNLIDAQYSAVGDTVLVVGRAVSTGAQQSYLFTVASHRWELLNIGPKMLRTGGSLVSIQNAADPIVVAFGGLSSPQVINTDTVVINLKSNNSTRIISDRSAPNRTLHAALSYGGNMWIFGGRTSALSASISNEMWTFSLSNFSWNLVPPASVLVPPPTISHVFHPVGHRAVMVGGQSLHPGSAVLVPNLHAWAYDFTTRIWSSAFIPNFIPCIDMAAASHKHYLFVYGGYILGADEVSGSMWGTSTKGDITSWAWKVLSTIGPEPRRAAFLGVVSSSLVLYGGRSNSVAGSSLSDMWEYGIDVADPKFSKVFGPNSNVAYVGNINYFDIELRNVFNDVISNSVFNHVDFWLLFVGNLTRFRGTIEHRADVIRVIFNPQYVGQHLAYLRLNSGTISLSNNNQPFPINVLASSVVTAASGFNLLFPNGTAAPVDSTLSVAAGDSLLFEIDYLDKLSNSGEYLARTSFQWYKIKIVPGTESSGNPVEYLDSTGTPPFEITSSGGGNVFITGTLLEVANYSIIVKMGNQLVGGVTYNFTLLSAALDPSSSIILLDESTATGTTTSGIRRYPVGETVRIVILLRDRFGNNITYALGDSFFSVKIISSSVPVLEPPAGKSDPLPENVKDFLSASNYENEAFSLVISDVVIEGVLLPKRIIRFFPFSLGNYHLHLATSDGQYVQGKQAVAVHLLAH